jgi:hypothetical protein
MWKKSNGSGESGVLLCNKDLFNHLDEFYTVNFKRKLSSLYKTIEYNKYRMDDSPIYNVVIASTPAQLYQQLTRRNIQSAKLLVIYCFFCDTESFNKKPGKRSFDFNQASTIYSDKINPFSRRLEVEIKMFITQRKNNLNGINLINLIQASRDELLQFVERYKAIEKLLP